ncbi:MAG: hypothetical protein FWF29_02170, partial [Treponema sp.]|nr:hypothetical protein [Treponema sp.]
MYFLESGEFTVGANYWASHAGTNMWRDWRPDTVEEDFKRLARANITTLRVFPLWPDFQPITALYGGHGYLREYAFGENSLPDTPEGQAGMSIEAMDHFGAFCAIADKYGIKLVVGLITGWMSGRLYVPPALYGRNVLTDPVAILWEVRFIRCFISRFKNEKAIAAWDLGNECNCMAPVESPEAFYVWTSQITGAIRSIDQTRPVISGMHSLLPDNNWTIAHQGELTDILTTHPYPYFTPHCDMDPVNTMRTELHATAETLFYRGIGGKPCFVEECGTLGPMFADEDTAADFVRVNLFSLWAHDCRAFFWWCVNEQTSLTHPPYNWNSVERELGLFRGDMSGKPALNVMSDFTRFITAFHEKYPVLPRRITDGVCVLTRGQDTWGAAYMAFILAKQAGLDIEFTHSDLPPPKAPLYIIPSVCGDTAFTGAYFKKIMEYVGQGAVLYLSLESGLLSPFEEIFGLRVLTRRKSEKPERITFTNDEGDDGDTDDVVDAAISLQTRFKLKMASSGAHILAADSEGDPMFAVRDYGKGKVFFLSAPLEKSLTLVPDAFGSADSGASEYYRFYGIIARYLHSQKAARIKSANIGLTEHIVNDCTRLLVLINYDP